MLDATIQRTCRQHHSEECDEKVGVFPESHVGLTTGLLKLLKLFGLQSIVTIGYGVDEVVGQHKRNSFSADSKLFLVMAEEMSEVYVENLPV